MKKWILSCVIFAFACSIFGCIQLNQEVETGSITNLGNHTQDSITNLGTYTQNSFSIDAEKILGEMPDEKDTNAYFLINDPIVFKKEKVGSKIVCTNREFGLCFAVENSKNIPKSSKLCITLYYGCMSESSLSENNLDMIEFDIDPFFKNVRICTLENVEELIRAYEYYYDF